MDVNSVRERMGSESGGVVAWMAIARELGAKVAGEAAIASVIG